ncbi:MAG: hypothetical protein R3240_03575, partial [Gammaproteobacteria bacterium]|nr:hypothetical protein [Gammaproteobacteria bacterium]
MKHCLIRKLVFSIALVSCVPAVQAFDLENYQTLAGNTIRQMNSGVAGDIDALIAVQEQLMLLGQEGSATFLQTNPANSQALIEVLENAEAMKTLSLEE